MWTNYLLQNEVAREPMCHPFCAWTNQPTNQPTKSSSSHKQLFSTHSLGHLLLRLLSHPLNSQIRCFRPTIVYHLSHYFLISKDPWHIILYHFTSRNSFSNIEFICIFIHFDKTFFFRSFLPINSKAQYIYGSKFSVEIACSHSIN